MKHLLWIVPLACSVGCSRGAGWPIDEGRTWVYRLTENGDPVDGTLTIAITGKERVGDEDCYAMEYKLDGEVLIKRWVTSVSSGIQEYRTKVGAAQAMEWKEPGWYIKAPLETGAQYGDRVDMGPPFGGKMIFGGTVQTQEKVTVPAGTYDAWRIQYKATSGTAVRINETLWLVPDVGVVKLEVEAAAGAGSNLVRFAGELKEVR